MSPPRILLSLLFAFSSAAFADFHVESTSNYLGADSAGNVPLHVAAVNATRSAATNVQVIYNDPVASIDAPGWSCASSKCTLDHPLAAGESATIDFRVHFDQPYGRKFVRMSVSGNVAGKIVGEFVAADVVLYRRFVVTQNGDAGAGSVRAAVEALNADSVCATLPCAINFDLTDPVIALQSPLPQITGQDVLVDGAVTLDGKAAGGNGLDFNVAERAEVNGMTIANFGDNAILLRLTQRTSPFEASRRLMVTHCTIEHNLRGIGLAPGYVGQSVIRDNILRDNVRSAIFDYSLHDPAIPLLPRLRIERNRITGNGASGIFLGEGSDGALITDNVIESNRDFGIAVARGAREVRILANSIAHNGGSAIDVGLDGPTVTFPGNPIDRNAAQIDFARYDPVTNITTITGRPSVTPIPVCDLCGTHIVSIYANDAAEHGEFAEAEIYLGEAEPNGSGFVFTFNGDLRGKYVTALATRWWMLVGSSLYDTGELSKAFLVR